MPDLEVVGGGAPAPTPPKKYRASIYPSEDGSVSAEFAEIIFELEKALNCKVWCLIRQGEEKFDDMSIALYDGFREQRHEIRPKDRIGLLVHSPGGQIWPAYKIVRLFQRRVEDFFTIVPLSAKSAATLVAIGGKEIVMGSEAELGPLDVQIWDDEAEDHISALNAVQAFDRLNSYSLLAFDQAMQLLIRRLGKKPIGLVPFALQYATSIINPMADKIDTIELTRKSRELKVAEEYAKRVMRAYYSPREYTAIASALVERYPTHGFSIERSEAGTDWGQITNGGRVSSLGLKVATPSPTVEETFTRLEPYLVRDTIIGRISEVGP